MAMKVVLWFHKTQEIKRLMCTSLIKVLCNEIYVQGKVKLLININKMQNSFFLSFLCQEIPYTDKIYVFNFFGEKYWRFEHQLEVQFDLFTHNWGFGVKMNLLPFCVFFFFKDKIQILYIFMRGKLVKITISHKKTNRKQSCAFNFFKKIQSKKDLNSKYSIPLLL